MGPAYFFLKREHFEAFERGEKTAEYRRVVRHWRVENFPKGRDVVIRLGYSGRELRAIVTHSQYVKRSKAPKAARDIYPDDDVLFEISVRLLDRQRTRRKTS